MKRFSPMLVMAVLILASCNCDEYDCRGMQPLAINFENYTLDDSDHIAIERYERGSNFTNRLSAFAMSSTEPSFYRNFDVAIDLYRYDIESPEKYDFKIILLKDSSAAYVTNLERRVVKRRSCGYFHTKEAVAYLDDCPIGSMKVTGDKVSLQDDGSLLWKK